MAVDRLAARAFDARAEDYERGRPGWPVAAVAGALERFGAGRDATVLDLAAGTGKLTERLVELVDHVIAVEPVAGMRRVLTSRLGVRVLDGTAEAIPLADRSVDAAFVAEAFHWFDLPRAAAELARVLRPGGGLALLWNVAQWDSEPWFAQVHELLDPHRQAVGGSRRANVPWREAFAADGRFEPVVEEVVAHEQVTDRDGLLAQIASFSWIGGLPESRRQETLGAVRAVLDRHGVGALRLRFRTKVCTTRRIDG